jgi:transcriptional regulator with XRE-family HTH domain
MADLDHELREGIKRSMVEIEWTMRDLSSATGIPYRSVQNYLTGKSRMPAAVLVEICQAMTIDVEYVLNGTMNAQKWPLFDALWDAFGDFLLDLEAREDNIPIDDFFRHNKKREKAARFAELIATSYGEYRRRNFLLRRHVSDSAIASEGTGYKPQH